MPGKGIQFVPLRYPAEMPAWQRDWFDRVLVKDVLAKLDPRNGINGGGIAITGQSSEQVTLAVSEDLQQLFDADFMLAEANPLLPNARTLVGEPGFINVTDSGPGGTLQVGIDQGMNPEWTGIHQWFQSLYGPMGTAALPSFSSHGSRHAGVYFPDVNQVGIATDSALRWDVDTVRTYQNLPQQIGINVAVADTSYDVLKYFNTANVTTVGGFTLRFMDRTPLGDDHTSMLGFWGRGNIQTSVPPPSAVGFEIEGTGGGAVEAYFRLHRYNGSTSPNTVFQVPTNADQFQLADGSAAAPVITFIGAQTNGFYWDAANSRLSATINGVRRAYFSATHFRTNQPIYAEAGNAGAPSYSFNSDTNTGMYNIGTDNLGLSLGGTLRWDINTTRIVTTLPQQGPAGSAGTPTYSASGDPNTGMYLPGSDVLAFSTAGTLRYQFGAAGQFGIGGATYGTANTQAIVSGGASAAPSWQTVLVDGQTQTLGGAKTWSGNHRWNDSVEAQFGAGNDLRVYHDGAASYIDNATGQLRFPGQITAFTHASAVFIFGGTSLVVDPYFQADVDHSLYLGTSGSGRLQLGPAGEYLLLAGLGNYADDAAAAAGGIAVNQLYRNGSIVQIRVS